MTTDQVPKADVRYTESPASWNVRDTNRYGFVYQQPYTYELARWAQ
jgi:hypothetical protein